MGRRGRLRRSDRRGTLPMGAAGQRKGGARVRWSIGEGRLEDEWETIEKDWKKRNARHWKQGMRVQEALQGLEDKVAMMRDVMPDAENLMPAVVEFCRAKETADRSG